MGKKDAAPQDRAGEYLLQPAGYKAFIPRLLPPKPAVMMDEQMIHLLSLADRAIGRLDAATDNLPDPDFFVYMYVAQEATLSSQIEGTQATLIDALELQADISVSRKSRDADEIINYINAMKYGLGRLKKENFPLSLRLIREIHNILLHGVRGQNREPGQFRQIQNFIGPEGCTLETAIFIPPPAYQMHDSLRNLEQFMHQQDRIPALIKASLTHAQFETIHPFLDGNGRIGRLLMTLFLCQKNILRQPILYLSHYFKKNRLLYYDHLQAIRDYGNWEGWIEFFLKGVHSVAQQASENARKIIDLREKHRQFIQSKLGRRSNSALVLLDKLYTCPIVSAKIITNMLGVTAATANNLLKDFVRIGILQQQAKKRNRLFRYTEYLNLFTEK